MNYLGYSWVDMNMNLDEGHGPDPQGGRSRPSDGYIVDSLGWAYYRLGKFDDAVRELERAVSLKPDDPVLNDHLGDAYWRGGRKLEATFQWAHARDMKPDQDVLAERPEEAGRRPAAARGQDGGRTAERQRRPPAEPAAGRRTKSEPIVPAAPAAASADDRGDRAGRLYGAARPVAVVDRRRQARQRHALLRDPRPQPAAAAATRAASCPARN